MDNMLVVFIRVVSVMLAIVYFSILCICCCVNNKWDLTIAIYVTSPESLSSEPYKPSGRNVIFAPLRHCPPGYRRGRTGRCLQIY
ncbi:hypothetical protein C0J52_03266 [Blattella germanica]|nr:hypothetical protein C0J52_03266 [Blattella germanica]